MMYVEARVDDGDEYYRDILAAYQNMLHGSLRGVWNRFTRTRLIEIRSRHRDRLGPLDVGVRASTKDFPEGHILQVYHKGPLVLHMLRELLREQTGSDEAFVSVLRDFLKAHQGGLAGTEDFRAVVERHAPGDWSWFFEQWVYRAEIPTYRWSYQSGRLGARNEYSLQLTVERSDVPEDFRMPVPVEVELKNGDVTTFHVLVDENHEVFRETLPAPAKRVVFNPDYAVLAKVRKK